MSWQHVGHHVSPTDAAASELEPERGVTEISGEVPTQRLKALERDRRLQREPIYDPPAP